MVLSPRNKYQFSPPVCGGLHRLSSRRHVNHTCHSCSLHHTFHGRYFPRVAGDSRRDKANTINKVQSGIAHVYQVIEICHRSLPVVEFRLACCCAKSTHCPNLLEFHHPSRVFPRYSSRGPMCEGVNDHITSIGRFRHLLATPVEKGKTNRDSKILSRKLLAHTGARNLLEYALCKLSACYVKFVQTVGGHACETNVYLRIPPVCSIVRFSSKNCRTTQEYFPM